MNNNYNSNTVVKEEFAIIKQFDGRAGGAHDRHNSVPAGPELMGGEGVVTPPKKSQGVPTSPARRPRSWIHP